MDRETERKLAALAVALHYLVREVTPSTEAAKERERPVLLALERAFYDVRFQT